MLFNNKLTLTLLLGIFSIVYSKLSMDNFKYSFYVNMKDLNVSNIEPSQCMAFVEKMYRDKYVCVDFDEIIRKYNESRIIDPRQDGKLKYINVLTKMLYDKDNLSFDELSSVITDGLISFVEGLKKLFVSSFEPIVLQLKKIFLKYEDEIDFIVINYITFLYEQFERAVDNNRDFKREFAYHSLYYFPKHNIVDESNCNEYLEKYANLQCIPFNRDVMIYKYLNGFKKYVK